MLILQLSILSETAMIDIDLNYVPQPCVGDLMSSSNNNQDVKSEINEAIKKVDAKQIDKNLQQDKAANKPEDLTDAEKTPFIDEQQRTDK